ncbi:M43 family zinc metalloprotease [Algoriphagus hitonicola]
MNISGAGGYAFYPPGYDSSNPLTSFYGFVIDKRLSTKTMLHEIGHFLGLRHTFVNDTDLCEDGDRLPDTEFYNQDRKIFDEQMIQNCEGEFFYASNFMDYRPSARNSFTLDQVNKIRGTIQQANFLPVESSPVARIKPRPWKKGKFDPTVKPIK